MTSPEVRSKLVDALKLDLIGPWPGHPFAHELLPENPTRWYLTGYLVPETAPVQHRSDAEAREEVDAGGEGGGNGDEGTPDKAASPSLLPSSMGLSVLVPAGASKLHAEVTWGDYHWEDPTKEVEEPADEGLGLKEEIKPESYEIPESSAAALKEEPDAKPSPAPSPKGYRRSARRESVGIELHTADGKPVSFPVPNSGSNGGLRLVVTARPIAQDSHSRLPKGTRAVCVFLVNSRPAAERAYQGNAFQAHLQLKCEAGFVARPDLRAGDEGFRADDWDEQVADLQYRRAFDFVSGIGCAGEPVDMQEGGACHVVQTCWIPSAGVEFVGHLDAAALPGVELGMEALATLANVEEARAQLGKLVEHYQAWIIVQKSEIDAEVGLERVLRKFA
ncbi:hypothetical protein LBMAG56_49550 [Verrucomicrobiota bacterium]|nr:hypothetical protein LBMAG56_49550 [Verrucomicrobiota bacterium]